MLLISCAHNAKSDKDFVGSSPTVNTISGNRYTTIEFPEGVSKLNKKIKQELRIFSLQSRESGQLIDEIKILAWADTEYPNKKETKASPQNVILASERAHNIKAYLKEELRERNEMNAYNMAKRPGLFSQMTKNDEYKMKDAFEKSGTTGSTLSDGSISYTKASKVLVIIDYERKNK